MKPAFLNPALLLLGLAACKKTDISPKMPVPTHDGRRVIAWRLNGEVYVAEGLSLNGDYYAVGSLRPIQIGSDSSILILIGDCITGNGASRKRASVSFECLYTSQQFNQKVPLVNNYPYFFNLASPEDHSLIRDSTGLGSFGFATVTYLDSTVVAGTFQYQIVDPDGSVFRVTDGIFDLPRY